MKIKKFGFKMTSYFNWQLIVKFYIKLWRRSRIFIKSLFVATVGKVSLMIGVIEIDTFFSQVYDDLIDVSILP